jgi:hypothetical protein
VPNNNNMNDYSSIQDVRAFDEAIFDMVEGYLKDNDNIINENDGIYIDSDLSLSIKSINEVTNKDNFYPISKLVRMDENNMIEADCDETFELANKYIFVG